ncbi:2'-5' RNA ligase family protein [Aequorivita flava]|uniref:2'-5' RNA ligase family protein n=1 Tax=Aequorivita flava TaxID=3114371 RepID=A0AB35YT63_9FLAO
MKKYFIAAAIAFGLLSCTTKEKNIIAVDVLLIPSEEMQAQAFQLNSLIYKNNPETIKLDENHVPHITLLQCFINESDLPKVNKALEGLFETIKEENFKAESLFYYEEKEESFSMIRVENSKALMEIHKKSIELLKPFIVANGSENSFVQNPDGSAISKSTVTYVPAFVLEHSYENFDPHISLGVADVSLLDSLAAHIFKPIKFRAASVSLYQLGDHGTAQKLLWTSE